MRPGSAFLEELDAPVPGCRTRFITYWSDADQVVLPSATAPCATLTWPGATSKLHGVGHISMPIVGTVVQGISEALAQLDHEGHTTREGARRSVRADAPERSAPFQPSSSSRPVRRPPGGLTCPFPNPVRRPAPPGGLTCPFPNPVRRPAPPAASPPHFPTQFVVPRPPGGLTCHFPTRFVCRGRPPVMLAHRVRVAGSRPTDEPG